MRTARVRLDVVVPTFNRCELLARLLESLAVAEAPAGLEVYVTIVDNNSTDDTEAVVAAHAARFGGRLRRIVERQQGRSHALNAGIASTDGDLVATVDDDEEIDGDWYRVVAGAFARPDVDFVGGPYVPRWGAEPPAWLPPDYPGVIGWIDGGPVEAGYGADYPGMLMGGNAVFRRVTLERVGPYATWLGRKGRRLMSCEDEDMYRRLLAAGARGRYLPELRVFHYVPPERLTKRYYRRWCYWHGVSRGMLDRRDGFMVVTALGVPRWLLGRAVRKLADIPRAVLSGSPSRLFADELALWDLAGFVHGRHFARGA